MTQKNPMVQISEILRDLNKEDLAKAQERAASAIRYAIELVRNRSLREDDLRTIISKLEVEADQMRDANIRIAAFDTVLGASTTI